MTFWDSVPSTIGTVLQVLTVQRRENRIRLILTSLFRGFFKIIKF